MRYLENLPTDICELAQSTLDELRTGRPEDFEPLTVRQQKLYDKLGKACLVHIVNSPEAALLLGKLGPNEEAYGLNLAEIDGAVLRTHFYTREGSHTVDPALMAASVVDVDVFGTPHNHIGDISAVVPRGRLTHYTYKELQGENYTAGHIEYQQSDDPTKSYKFRQSIFVPDRQVSLELTNSGSFDNQTGYQMRKEVVHLVNWDQPTITVFFNDFQVRHQSTIYQRSDVNGPLERPRALDEDTRHAVWQAMLGTIEG